MERGCRTAIVISCLLCLSSSVLSQIHDHIVCSKNECNQLTPCELFSPGIPGTPGTDAGVKKSTGAAGSLTTENGKNKE